MKITDYIRNVFKPKDSVLTRNVQLPSWAFDPFEKFLPFGRVIWTNIIELLTSLCNDVTFSLVSGDVLVFAQFKRFFESWGELVMVRLFDEGAVVIGYDEMGFRLLDTNEYTQVTRGNTTIIKPMNANIKVYVMKSPSFAIKGLSDKMLCQPFIEFLDNVLNASNTCSARLGNLVVGSPSQSSAMPTATVLTKEQKDSLEKDLSNEYGALRQQKQFLLLPRSMQFQTISLASVDMRTSEKARLAILAICDRIKVPANQVAIIDATSSKSLANGSELREGDFNKYQSFERLLNRTFVQMAQEMHLTVNYTIYNKPTRYNNGQA